MPTITLLKGRGRPKTFNTKARQCLYQDPRWKRLRAVKFRDNPLCERCLEKNPQVVRPTKAIHHIIEMDIYNPNEDLMFSYDNLQSLCAECHNDVHGRGMNPVEKQIAERREVR